MQIRRSKAHTCDAYTQVYARAEARKSSQAARSISTTQHQEDCMMAVYVLLDDEGQPVRYFDHNAPGTIEIVEPKLTLDELFEKFGECLL